MEQKQIISSNVIKPINSDTVHKICSGQVVLSLSVAVKELVENSLDAGATNIDIRFKNYGVDLIEVSDNGTGVTEDNFEALALKHHTSKLSEYSDLLGVSSFGFRGEALSSLCALANLTITTRHKTADYATKIEYDLQGHIIKTTRCSRQVGTTVNLTNLFHSLPVRQKEFHKNVKREFNKMTQLLYAYCLISLGVKITCSNQTNTNSKSLVVATQGSSSYKDNITCIFGIKQIQNILEITPVNVNNIRDNIFRGLTVGSEDTQESVIIEDVDIQLSEDSNDAQNDDDNNLTEIRKLQGYKNIAKPVEFVGFISSCEHGSGRSSTDRQFYYVNNRPCEPTKITKLINDLYRQFNPNQYPFVFLNVNIDSTSVDVNVTPDKRKIFLTREKNILEVMKLSLLRLFENIPRTLKIEISQNINGSDSYNDTKPVLDQPRIFSSFLQQFGKRSIPDNNLKSDTNNSKKLELKRKSTSMLDFIQNKAKKTENINIVGSDSLCSEEIDKSENCEKHSDFQDIKEDIKDILSMPPLLSDLESSTQGSSQNSEKYLDSNTSSVKTESIQDESQDILLENKDVIYLEFTDNLPNTQIRSVAEVLTEQAETVNHNAKRKTVEKHISPKASTLKTQHISKKSKVITDSDDLGKLNRKTVILKTSLEHVKALTDIYKESNNRTLPNKIKFRAEINPVFNKKCEEELTKEISKDDFKKMNVVGQFNLGFIITKLEDDLFIIDQHATDEIYNFETLQKTTELTSQKLVVPKPLELSGVNEQILIDNLDVFRKNGFTFAIDQEALPTKRVKLMTIPMSKNWIFGKEDIEELLFMLRESPTEYCRPSRVRAMFASRACRKSVMIGTALKKTDMKVLVDHMAEIDKPWNCPHGRPTIRHLVNLAMIHTRQL